MAKMAKCMCRVVAATNRPSAVDPALRRPGRLDREVAVAPPSATQRAAILRHHARCMPLHASVSLDDIAASCHGFTGADLSVLCREAAMRALADAAQHAQRSGMSSTVDTAEAPASMPDAQVREEHWAHARKQVQPSLVRGMAEDVAPLAWADIGGLTVRPALLRPT